MSIERNDPLLESNVKHTETQEGTCCPDVDTVKVPSYTPVICNIGHVLTPGSIICYIGQ